ncbi:HAD family hydrolase [Pseudolysobacter antarcticus]|uniref:HAD family hydrolase n=1 Tax=Pseudolysobacter antarcticus TaxID=2511995 RepID=A0A411HI45_9GAMM|nr:HAD family hydrolase [Pseudolysobacter antarcticus]QBB70070.1 HAD family hydrolase [Pseudolysobacter antarcticus]
MLSPPALQFLLDVDNTLLDNDRFASDLGAFLDQTFGEAERARYWAIYAELRDMLGYADYLGALQRFRIDSDNQPGLLQVSAFLLDYPFGERLYPRALAAIEHLRRLGGVAILSDGDMVFQPRKIQRSGVWQAVDGHVLVYLHKEKTLDAMQRALPAQHYVMIDDKPQILAAMKRVLGERLTTLFVRQGHYARDAQMDTIHPAPDLIIDTIGEVGELTLPDFKIPTETRSALAHAD